MVLQPYVRLADHGIDVRARIDDQHSVDALLRGIDRADNGRLANAWLLVEHSLDVLGKHIEAVGRDDHFLLAPLDEQTPLRIAFTNVAGVQPAVGVEWSLCVGSWELGVGSWALGVWRFGDVVAGSHVLATNQDLAIVGDANLDTLDRRADRALAHLERVVKRDDRRGFGQAVALDHGKAEPPPELLDLRWQRRRADDERPELESEGRVHAAVLPPASGNGGARRRRLGGFGKRMDDVFAKHVEDLRH